MALADTSPLATCDVWTELPPLSSFSDLAEDTDTKETDQSAWNFADLLGIEPDDPYSLPAICEIDDSVALAMISAFNNDKLLAHFVGDMAAPHSRDKVASVATRLSEVSDDSPSALRSAAPKAKKRSAPVQQLHDKDEGSLGKRKNCSAEEKRAFGLCTVRCCGNAPVPGGARCQPHRDQINRKKQEERDKKKARARDRRPQRADV